MDAYFTYMPVSKPYAPLYIGVTNGLLRRVEQHRAGTGSKLTSEYKIFLLVLFEIFADVRDAIQREETI